MGNICSSGSSQDADDRPYQRTSSQRSVVPSPRNSTSARPPLLVQATPQVQRNFRSEAKINVTGDVMTIQSDLVQVKCVDNRTAKWIKSSGKIENELSILRSLNHPNVIRLLFTFNANDTQYIAYEPMKNSLSMIVRNLNNYKDIIWQLVDAVEYLQQRRIVHLSLSPSSISVIEDNQKQIVKIGSFDCAMRIEGRSANVPKNVRKNMIYSAPEVLNGTKVCLASDIFSLGSVIFHVFSKGGKLVNASIVSSIASQRNETVDNAGVLCADLICKLVQKSADDRLKSDQVKKHPFFWDTDKTINFIIKINKLIEAGDAKFRKCLFFNSKNALGGSDDWSLLVEDDVLDELDDGRKDFIKRTGRRDFNTGKKNIITLIQVMRHVTVHSQKTILIKMLMGSDEDFLEFWLERFPYLIQHMYNANIRFTEGNFETRQPKKRIRSISAK